LTITTKVPAPKRLPNRYSGSLELADVYAILTCYLRHKSELDARIAEQDREADEKLGRLGVVEGSRNFRALLEERRKGKL